MSKEKQIEEMAKDLCHSTMCDLETYNNCRMPQGNCGRCQRVAEDLYNAGYRKQSDWISVDESLPEKDGRYLVAMKDGDKYHISTRRFKRTDPPIWWKGHVYGYWAKRTGGVRFWMPLPEPPKMKGVSHD